MESVRLSGVRKAYGPRTVLDVAELTLSRGEFFVLLGPSGSGKTTLLRILAGLLRPDAGRVWIEGKDAAGVPPHERPIGVVFQGLALWPHLTVRGNLALGLSRVARTGRDELIRSVSEELGIEPFLNTKPGRLSGGERQRVALARALVRRPSLLLLDEAFSDLDARLRRSTARLVRRLHDEHSMTTLLITHDRTDAHLLADRIGVMRDGRLIACGAPDELYRAPGSAFAAEFLSDAALLSGRAKDGRIETVLGSMPLADASGELGELGELIVAVRPDEIRIGGGEGSVTGRVIACEFAGGPWRCRLDVGGQEVVVQCDAPLKAGDEVALTPPAEPRVPLRSDRSEGGR